jgi:hypothetical protein
MTPEAADATDSTVERGAAEEGTPLTPTEVDASRRPPSAPGLDSDEDPASADAPGAAPPMSPGDPADAPLLTGDDVRLGAEQADRPQAGTTEPPD